MSDNVKFKIKSLVSSVDVKQTVERDFFYYKLANNQFIIHILEGNINTFEMGYNYDFYVDINDKNVRRSKTISRRKKRDYLGFIYDKHKVNDTQYIYIKNENYDKILKVVNDYKRLFPRRKKAILEVLLNDKINN